MTIRRWLCRLFGKPKPEWEVYPEPIWDDAEFEARLAVKEYFKKGKADNERERKKP